LQNRSLEVFLNWTISEKPPMPRIRGRYDKLFLPRLMSSFGPYRGCPKDRLLSVWSLLPARQAVGALSHNRRAAHREPNLLNGRSVNPTNLLNGRSVNPTNLLNGRSVNPTNLLNGRSVNPTTRPCIKGR